MTVVGAEVVGLREGPRVVGAYVNNATVGVLEVGELLGFVVGVEVTGFIVVGS